MLFYNYLLVFENVFYGMLLMCLLVMVYGESDWFENVDSYLWGDGLLVFFVMSVN